MLEYFQYIFNKLYKIGGFDKFSVNQIYYFLGVVLIVFILELLLVGWERSAFKKVIRLKKSVRRDIAFWFFEIFNLYNIIAFIISLGTCYYLVGIIQRSINFDIEIQISNIYLLFLFMFVISDLNHYIRHRIFHSIKPLWAIHSFHHSATTLSILTRYRTHFLELSLGRFFDVIPFILFDAPIYTFFAVKILADIHQLINHSSIKSNWWIIGKYILVSPAAHRVHHSIEFKHFNKNFGITFIFWDRLFGSYYPPEDIKCFGIPQSKFNEKNFIFDIWWVIVSFIREIKKQTMKH